MADERRSSERHSADDICAALTVIGEVGVQGADQCFGIVRDVSSAGVGIKMPMPPPFGARVVMLVNLGETLHEVRMVVRRRTNVAGMWDVGLAFVQDEHASAFVREFHSARLSG